MGDEEKVIPLPPEAMGLVAQLIQHNYDSYAATTQQLLEGLMDENAKLRAERDLIREGINQALANIYTPSPNYILGLLFPSRELIAERIKFEKEVTG